MRTLRLAPPARPRDPRIARALDALEQHVADRWTVAKLAKVAGMSRAAFARRFLDEVGAPPLRHLVRLRLERAVRLLTSTTRGLAEIASDVGYASEFAFSRAFRRSVGEPPGVYRRRIRACSAVLAAA